MTKEKENLETLFSIYKLHTELAEQASYSRENMNKIYSGMVIATIAGSVLIHRVAPDSGTMWVLPVLGIVISFSWMMSLLSATGRLFAKHKTLLELESKLPFAFLKREKDSFDNLFTIRRKWTALLMPVLFLIISAGWLVTLFLDAAY